jgi:hypothetical protein
MALIFRRFGSEREEVLSSIFVNIVPRQELVKHGQYPTKNSGTRGPKEYSAHGRPSPHSRFKPPEAGHALAGTRIPQHVDT